jgi:hypothetical protein
MAISAAHLTSLFWLSGVILTPHLQFSPVLITYLQGTTRICLRNRDKVDICESGLSGLIYVGGSQTLENDEGVRI